MSEWQIGKKLSQEHKNKIAQSHIGIKPSNETRKRLSESHKGKEQSIESRIKRSNTIKEWWAKRKSSEDIVKS